MSTSENPQGTAAPAGDAKLPGPPKILFSLDDVIEITQDAIGDWGGPQREYFTEAMHRVIKAFTIEAFKRRGLIDP